MADEKLLTVRDAAAVLGIAEKEIMDLAENGSIPAYKIGGVYLRFKPSQLELYQKSINPAAHKSKPADTRSAGSKLSDFLYFNDFYIIAAAVIVLLFVIIFRGS
ncbi:helix-turn-helix domain-containing protein [Candidatus Omnitrophota bacterium]